MANLEVWRHLSTKSKCWEKFITTGGDRTKIDFRKNYFYVHKHTKKTVYQGWTYFNKNLLKNNSIVKYNYYLMYFEM